LTTPDLKNPFRWEMVPFTRGEGIQVNAKDEKYFPHFLGVGAEKLRLFAGAVFDFAVCDDLAETTVPEIWRVIKPGGHLVLTQPAGIPLRHPPAGWDCKLRCERDVTREFGSKKHTSRELMVVYQRRSDKGMVHTWKDSAPDGKTACVVRFGAVGDIIQTSSVLACLREAGYHITLMCHSGNCYEVARTDPNVDSWIIQDMDQVPNEWLGAYWTHWMGKFDKFVNLSGSVESTWLAIEHRYPFYWPQAVRHHYLNENYLEFMHRLAGVPLKYRPRFYPTAVEKQWAQKQKKKMGGKVILWALSGSSVHKFWPHMDALVARIMLHTDYKVVLVGDELCRALEIGWEKEPRVVKKSGEWDYRKTLAFASCAADLVIGPETGTMNAVSFLDVPKVLFLSHSSHENLSRDWIKTKVLSPERHECPCYPCHILHTNGFAWCSRDEATGAALCQAKIDVETAWNAVHSFLREL